MTHTHEAAGQTIGIAAVLGALVGVLVRPVWTDTLIGAQILAGVVTYPADSLMPLVYLRPHSVLTQIAALLLTAGLGEWTVALLFSGLQAALGCAAIAALSLVFVRNRLVALFVPVLLLRFGEALPLWPGQYLRVFHGHLYPNTFPVGPGVFGVVGMFAGLLALALIGLGRRRAGAWLVGFLPAVHVGMAIPMLFGLGVVAWNGRTHARGEWHSLLKWFATGLACALVTVALYATYVPAVPAGVDPVQTNAIGQLLVDRWDDHTRLLVGREWLGFFESEIYTVGLIVMLLAGGGQRLSVGARAVVWVVAMVTAVGVTYTIVMNLWPGLVPWPVRAALITRWLNISSWFFPVVAISLVGQAAFERMHRGAAVLLATIVVLVWTRMATGITLASSLQTMSLAGGVDSVVSSLRVVGLAFPLLMVGGAVWVWMTASGSAGAAMPPAWRRRIVVALVLLWLLPFRNAAWHGAAGNGDCATVIDAASRGQGTLLLGADLWDAEWIQVRTRRPILFESMDLNILPFTPEVGPRVEEILREVYGQSLEDGLGERLDRHWPELTSADWNRIATRFNVTSVLVTRDLPLQLVPLAVDDGCSLYAMPELP